MDVTEFTSSIGATALQVALRLPVGDADTKTVTHIVSAVDFGVLKDDQGLPFFTSGWDEE